MKRIGLFGGSFDPVHRGHLAVARAALREAGLDEVRMLVSPQNPLKQGARPLTPAPLRLEMLRAALEDLLPEEERGRIVASDFELSLPIPTYTITTLRAISAAEPDCRFCWIVGEDNLRNFSHWRCPEEILSNYGLIVYPRQSEGSSKQSSGNSQQSSGNSQQSAGNSQQSAGNSQQSDAKMRQSEAGIRDDKSESLINLPQNCVMLKDVELFPESSTSIRQLIAEGIAPEELTSPRVASIIRQHLLYASRHHS